MATADIDSREAAKGQAKAVALETAALARTPARPPLPPSVAAARERQAARVRAATVARWLRRLSA